MLHHLLIKTVNHFEYRCYQLSYWYCALMRNIIFVVSRRRMGDNERLYAMKRHLQQRLEPGTLWFEVVSTNHSATWIFHLRYKNGFSDLMEKNKNENCTMNCFVWISMTLLIYLDQVGFSTILIYLYTDLSLSSYQFKYVFKWRKT